MANTARNLIRQTRNMLIAVACFSLPTASVAQERRPCDLEQPPEKQFACLLNTSPSLTPNLLEFLGRRSDQTDFFLLRSELSTLRRRASLAGLRIVDDRRSTLRRQANLAGILDDTSTLRRQAGYLVIHAFSTRRQDKQTGAGIHRSGSYLKSSLDASIDSKGKGEGDFRKSQVDSAQIRSQNVGFVPSWNAINDRLINVGIQTPSLLTEVPQQIGFTKEQTSALAVIYVYASILSRRWLIPVFHNNLETAFRKSSLDPTFLSALDNAISEIVREAEVPLIVRIQNKYLETALQIHEQIFKAHVSDLKLIERRSQDGTISKGYDVNEVTMTFVESRLELIMRLDPDEFAGMRAYVRKYYPLPTSLPTTQTEKSRRPIVLNAVYVNGGRSPQLGLLPADKLDPLVRRVLAFSSKLKENKSAIDLEVRSEPDGATVRLLAEGGAHRTRDTNSQITNLFRGLYNYTVTKEGFRSITQELNLVDERGTKLVCRLDPVRMGTCTLQ